MAEFMEDARNVRKEKNVTIEYEFYSLLEQVVKNPSQLDVIVEKLASVINSLDCNSDVIKFTFEFYKNLHPFPTEALLVRLFKRGVITDVGILRKSCLGPFLSQLLFQLVTEASVECAKYCTKLWIDRVSDKDGSLKTFPNPLEYLNPNSPTKPSEIPHSVLLQFKLLDDKQRKLIVLDFRKMANLIPPTFYPRMIVAFLIFLQFYKKEGKNQGSSVLQETCLWAETWHSVVLTSLSKCGSRKGHLPLHHILNAIMVSTKAFEFLSSMPDVSKNVFTSLQLISDDSAGFTKKWVSFLISELDRFQK